jgi:hypothetical protein
LDSRLNEIERRVSHRGGLKHFAPASRINERIDGLEDRLQETMRVVRTTPYKVSPPTWSQRLSEWVRG